MTDICSQSDEDEWQIVTEIDNERSVTETERSAARLRVLTWNIWFESFEVDARMAAISGIIQKEAPDIVALQEVTAELEGALLRMAAFSAYQEVPAPRSSSRYYTLLFAHKNLQWRTGLREPFPSSRHGRDHLMGRLEWRGIPLQVTNVQLESPDAQAWSPDDPGSTERCRQLANVLKDLTHADDAIVLGDFNHIPAKDGPFPELPPGASDVWEVLNAISPRDQGLTYDPRRNGCVRSKHTGRPDRVLFGARLLSPWTARLVGTDPLEGVSQKSGRPVMPSDHFGIFITFRISPEPEPLTGWTSAVLQPIVIAEVESNILEGNETWDCKVCGFKNREQNSQCGGMGVLGCKFPRPDLSEIESDSVCQVHPFLEGANWHCACGFKNRAGNKLCGGVNGYLGCKAPNPHAPPGSLQGYLVGGMQPTAANAFAKWTCTHCGFENRAGNSVCGGVGGRLGCKGPKSVAR